jgi:para-aminobenzoate synthetase component 1
VLELDLNADELISALLHVAEAEPVFILDSCGIGYLGSHLLIAGISPVEMTEIVADSGTSLFELNKTTAGNTAAIFTLSYDLGKELLELGESGIRSRGIEEPGCFIARFENLVIHDYFQKRTYVAGFPSRFLQIREKLLRAKEKANERLLPSAALPQTRVLSNFGRAAYVAAIEKIKEEIRNGNTYQTNLTQQFTAELPPQTTPAIIFGRLREHHPAAFSAFLGRPGSTVVSASPERFIHIDLETREMSTSPIKGTSPRGATTADDFALRQALLTSSKDHAENVMIVDLLRNDLGRIAEYGSVKVEKLCELEEYPTFFHLVSTVRAILRTNTAFSDVIKAVFPCGSITGAPKISTMKIIEELERVPRGLSMGAIGYFVPEGFGLRNQIDMSVAIRTMVIKDGRAKFNVGGGVTIDSDPDAEYDESLTKARALLAAMNGFIETEGNKRNACGV